MTRPYSRPSLQCGSYHPQCLHLPECEKARGRWRIRQKYSNDNFWYISNVNSYNLTFFLSCCFVSDWADRASFSSATSATPERDLDVQNIRCVRPWYVIVQNITISNFKISVVYALGMQLCKISVVFALGIKDHYKNKQYIWS